MHPAPGHDADPDEQPTLRNLRREFPQFAIWREVMPDRTRSNAQRLSAGHGLQCHHR